MTKSEEELIEELQRVFEEYCDGETPTMKEMNEYGDISTTTYSSRFGSWNDSVKKINLHPNTTPSSYNRTDNYTKEDLIEEIKRLEENKTFLY